MTWPQTGAIQYHAQLVLPDKGRAIKGLVVFNNWDLEPLDLLNGLALGCYQLSPLSINRIISMHVIKLKTSKLMSFRLQDSI